MKTKTGKWFEVTAKADSVDENRNTKRVSVSGAFTAETFGEAEEKAINFFSGEYYAIDVTAIKIAKYEESIHAEEGSIFYNVKVIMITINDYGKEEKTPIFLLVRASDIEDCRKIVNKYFKGSTLDYSISSISETKLITDGKDE